MTWLDGSFVCEEHSWNNRKECPWCRIAELEDALDNEQAKGVHSCGPNCQRPLCVANREIEELEFYVTSVRKSFKRVWDHKQSLRADNRELKARIAELEAERDERRIAEENYTLALADNERLAADCKAKERLIETQKQYLDNKDRAIKGLHKMIKKLEGDLEITRLQRDAKRWTKTPTDVKK